MKFPNKKYYNLLSFKNDYYKSLKDSFDSINFQKLDKVIKILDKAYKNRNKKILVCGGGRKNKNLIDRINLNIKKSYKMELIDDYGINGDFVESQAFAFLAIRSALRLPISFPKTTGCKNPTTGGVYIKFI